MTLFQLFHSNLFQLIPTFNESNIILYTTRSKKKTYTYFFYNENHNILCDYLELIMMVKELIVLVDKEARGGNV